MVTSCAELGCTECCGYDSGLQDNVCHDDVYLCKLDPQNDFTILFNTVIIILLFTITLPLIFYIVELIFLRRFKGSGLSVVEYIIEKICCCRNRRTLRSNSNTKPPNTTMTRKPLFHSEVEKPPSSSLKTQGFMKTEMSPEPRHYITKLRPEIKYQKV